MPPLEHGVIGDWLLRAADGFTGRANSVLVQGDPGVPLARAFEQVEGWYADRSLPPLAQLAGPSGFDPGATPAGAVAAERGWRFFGRVLVMTAASAVVADAPMRPNTAVAVLPEPDESWWSVAAPRSVEHRETYTATLNRIGAAAHLLAFRQEDFPTPSSAGRLAFAPGWAGVFDLHVLPDRRRDGLGRALVVEGARAVHDAGIPSMYLQVSADNHAAVELYRGLGFDTHHEYVYGRRD
ncbi:GNAT family N-acetyltransferase [Calidifontibacter sp. DB0510]|uniref:GNAT family N-acetyltransferase n=1 Tax=Metallococcus carri TaxID=1656884 RepID=A0A967B3Q5_9MICO|nr:GNAT family N-acetyltransferase [Metallococcus carri]NHN55077.1 GNAT family N-acetyltransferase [Metallococcus carri]NOP36154.1 GNAT family N-acetyltransferase [Calidifontibacter sp. DB2511S]